jgi:hypothetical protein
MARQRRAATKLRDLLGMATFGSLIYFVYRVRFVLLVGGSTKMPQIAARLGQDIKIEVAKILGTSDTAVDEDSARGVKVSG